MLSIADTSPPVTHTSTEKRATPIISLRQSPRCRWHYFIFAYFCLLFVAHDGPSAREKICFRLSCLSVFLPVDGYTAPWSNTKHERRQLIPLCRHNCALCWSAPRCQPDDQGCHVNAALDSYTLQAVFFSFCPYTRWINSRTDRYGVLRLPGTLLLE